MLLHGVAEQSVKQCVLIHTHVKQRIFLLHVFVFHTWQYQCKLKM